MRRSSPKHSVLTWLACHLGPPPPPPRRYFAKNWTYRGRYRHDAALPAWFRWAGVPPLPQEAP